MSYSSWQPTLRTVGMRRYSPEDFRADIAFLRSLWIGAQHARAHVAESRAIIDDTRQLLAQFPQEPRHMRMVAGADREERR